MSTTAFDSLDPSDSAAPPAILPASWREVHDACHRWLMARDPAYARDFTRNSARCQRVAANRKATSTKHQALSTKH